MRLRHILPLLALLVAACDSNDPGSSGVQVTGDLAAAFEPEATFQPDRADTNQPFTNTDLRLTRFRADGTSHALTLTLIGSLRPGTYPINYGGVAHARAIYTTYDDPEDLRTFEAQTGSIVVTRTTDNRLEGTFRLGAIERVQQGTRAQVEVSGTFSARRVRPQSNP